MLDPDTPGLGVLEDARQASGWLFAELAAADASPLELAAYLRSSPTPSWTAEALDVFRRFLGYVGLLFARRRRRSGPPGRIGPAGGGPLIGCKGN